MVTMVKSGNVAKRNIPVYSRFAPFISCRWKLDVDKGKLDMDKKLDSGVGQREASEQRDTQGITR
jgi:hypothetical protein